MSYEDCANNDVTELRILKETQNQKKKKKKERKKEIKKERKQQTKQKTNKKQQPCISIPSPLGNLSAKDRHWIFNVSKHSCAYCACEGEEALSSL